MVAKTSYLILKLRFSVLYVKTHTSRRPIICPTGQRDDALERTWLELLLVPNPSISDKTRHPQVLHA